MAPGRGFLHMPQRCIHVQLDELHRICVARPALGNTIALTSPHDSTLPRAYCPPICSPRPVLSTPLPHLIKSTCTMFELRKKEPVKKVAASTVAIGVIILGHVDLLPLRENSLTVIPFGDNLKDALVRAAMVLPHEEPLLQY